MDRTAAPTRPTHRTSALTEPPPFHTFLGLARYLTLSGLAGVAAGVVVGGVGGRLFMRIAGAAGGARARGAITEAGFTVGEITLGESLGLVIFIGLFTGIVGAALSVIFRPWLSWAGRWRGVAFGIVLFSLGSATSDVLNPDNVDFVILGNEVLVIALIIALFTGFGALIEPTFGWLDRRLPEGGRGHPIASGGYVVAAILGVVFGIALLGQAMFTRNACDCDPPIVASVFLLMAAVGTLGWIATAFSSSARLRSIARVLGVVGVSGASVAGLLRAIGDAAEVIRG
jgi:hypothetical protein